MNAVSKSEKVRETRLRRMAERQGLMLQKSRTRDPRALEYGRWWITDAETRAVVANSGDNRFDIDDVEAYLNGDLENLPNPTA